MPRASINPLELIWCARFPSDVLVAARAWHSACMEITRLNGALGARVTGIDWDAGLADGDFDGVEAALAEHGALVVDAVRMRREQHVELAAHFGELERHEFFDNQGEGFEHITVLDSERGDRSNMWHVDEQFLEKPPIITMTHAVRLPSYGGDTSFISLHAAYDGLSLPMRQYLDGLTAVHDLARIAEMAWQGGHGGPEHLADELRKGKQASHPVVLVRLSRIDRDALRDVLSVSWRLALAKARPRGRSGPGQRTAGLAARRSVARYPRSKLVNE